MKKNIFFYVLLLSFYIISCSKKSADTVIIGNIYTVEKNNKQVSAIAIKNGLYSYVGDENGVKNYIGEHTKVIYLSNGIVLPSFFDAHSHADLGGISKLYQVQLNDGTSIDEYANMISSFVNKHEDIKILRGSGWANGYVGSNGPHKDVLDKIRNDIPIVISSEDFHSIWANSKAMEIAGVDANTLDIKGGVIEREPITKEPTGTFREKAQELITSKLPDYSIEDYKNAILTYQEEVLSYGLTGVFDPLLNFYSDGDNLFKALNELDKSGELKIKYFAGFQILMYRDYLSDLEKVSKYMKESNGRNFKVTAIKLFIDGVVEGRTAFLIDDYCSLPGYRGEALWTEEKLIEVAKKAQELGLQIHIHCIGDGATKLALDALETLKNDTGLDNKRHTITHLQVVDSNDIKRMSDLKIIAATNPYWFFKEKGYFYELELPYLGKKRANSEYPMKSFFDANIIVSCASDYPITIPSRPLDAIQIGSTRMNLSADTNTLLGSKQIVSVEDMIYTATINGAYQNFLENEIGSIKVGKKADFVILDQNILEIEATNISKTKVLNTYINGEEVYSLE